MALHATALLGVVLSSAAYHVRPPVGGSPATARPGGRIAAAAALASPRVGRFASPRRARDAAMVSASREIAMPSSHASGASDGRSKKVFVLGGDGFCGWPTALHLADKGHEVVIIDNLSRRKIDVELGCASLTPITSPELRVETWNSLVGTNPIRYVYMDLAGEYDRFAQLLKEERPDTIVHFAEQRAAPYSMKNAACKR